MISRRPRMLLLVVLIVLCLGVVSASQAAVLTVTNTADDGSPGCLRWCIEQAQPGDEIQFDPSLDGQPIVLTGGELAIGKDLTIRGRGPDQTLIWNVGIPIWLQAYTLTIGTFSGEACCPTVLLSDVTINAVGERVGGIRNFGVLTLRRATILVEGRLAEAGVYSNGPVTIEQGRIVGGSGVVVWEANLTVKDSTIAQSRGSGIAANLGRTTEKLVVENTSITDNRQGGIVIVWGNGGHRIENSTIANNRMDGYDWVVAGIWHYTESWPTAGLRVANTTISNNHARADCHAEPPFPCRALSAVGGVEGASEIENCTISDNSAWRKVSRSWKPDVDGIGRGRVLNSVISNSRAETIRGAACGSWTTSLGHNLDNDGSCNFDQPSDQPNTDPMLGPLQDNGGPTWTHAPLEGSPVIDRGCCDPGTDQRGVPRPLDGNRDGVWICDIGAVEYVPYEFQVVGPGGDVIVIPPDSE